MPAEEGELFIKSFDYVMEGLGNRARLGRLKLLYRDPVWFESIRIVHKFVENRIDNALKAEQNRKESGQAEESEHQRYILLNEMVKETQDELDLRSQILAVFMPSRDATAFFVSSIIHALARNPESWSQLRTEVLSLGSRSLTFEALKSMKYLQWVMNESKYKSYAIFT